MHHSFDESHGIFYRGLKRFIGAIGDSSKVLFSKDKNRRYLRQKLIMERHKTSLLTLAGYLTLVLALSCNKDTPAPADDEAPPVFGEPVTKPKGQPSASAASAIIGPAGGVLQYEQAVRLEVPPEAVAQPTTFAIQPISNTLDDGSAAQAFRLMPEGVHFKKPIKVSFPYIPGNGDNPTARMVAFQRNDGIWCGVPTALDAQQHLLTVETHHFSDWVWFDMLSLRQDKETARAGETANLKLMEQVLGALMPASTIDSVPLAAMDDIGFSKDVTVSGWRIVSGPGTLEPKLNTNLLLGDAIYTAPTTVNEAANVEIQVEVESRNGYISDPTAPNGRRKLGKMILLTTIRLMPENFVQLKLNGAEQDFAHLGNARVVNGTLYIRTHNEQINLTLQCNGAGRGTYPGGFGNGQSLFSLTRSQGQTRRSFANFYRSCDTNKEVFNGSAVISTVEDYVEGTFTGNLYPVDHQSCDLPEATAVEFKFRIKRS
ncbi:ZU5 domain-containing protein [Parapedobacter luteus]|uniref:ZU5 domain-containing protein n=2 Tax=Parapedobacter luteus TaxID=623280 RepID=A0A1T5EDV1_9SPHI|nr:ZU5 domain-containing protein [Parapedobacter luteus]